MRDYRRELHCIWQFKGGIEINTGILVLCHYKRHDSLSREAGASLEEKVICLALNMLHVRYMPKLLSKILTRQSFGWICDVGRGWR